MLFIFLTQSMTEDCMKPEWYDMACFFKIRRPFSEDHIDGFASLRYSHQMQIRSKIGKNIILICNLFILAVNEAITE